ncbi:GNAT family N-acetyltransferase [Streptomyces sp. WMMC500]|uniref:GNAT family N-acetyltransferase n=1 Tax=Streptomyces sp. WMMC500 TaxID=3015154 RepID=UPI00248BCDEB|nr:GNAT family N-acetyltransferase [Streptomyces sp. WMMC500]WBB58082.1 GNAT family N-acetyltransferase [Streptomyces sp. WMMC500]
MGIRCGTPRAGELDGVVRVLGAWQDDTGPVQLHPGDLGWFWRFGAERTAAAVRTWRRAGEVLAVGLLDGAELLRLAVAPGALGDGELARRMAADVATPERGVLPAGEVYVAAPPGALAEELLTRGGWETAEPWTPLRRDLGGPVPDPGVHVEVVGPGSAAERAAVQRSAFGRSTFTRARWHTMAAAPPYADARCLLARDDRGAPVAAVTVWSAGEGRPGMIEPMGVHADHRGHGYGRAITLAAARTLRELGSSSVVVDTAAANTAAVATYESAGLRRLPDMPDLRRG